MDPDEQDFLSVVASDILLGVGIFTAVSVIIPPDLRSTVLQSLIFWGVVAVALSFWIDSHQQ